MPEKSTVPAKSTAPAEDTTTVDVSIALDADWPACEALRREVFVVGQDCPEAEEFDGLDAKSEHLLARLDGEIVGTARWRSIDIDGEPTAKLERFAVLESARGAGVGRRLVAASMGRARAQGLRRFLLHAQAHLESFYASFGFEIDGEGFEEAGIPHVRMIASDASPETAP